jgi:hypothetical protein
LGVGEDVLNFKRTDPMVFDVDRNYINMNYILQQDTVAFNEQYLLKFRGDPSNLTDQYSTHLNLGGLSAWYQMTSKPDFYKAF